MTEPWMAKARCNETDPDAFFPEVGGTSLPAKKICKDCEVKVACLSFALRDEETQGIWGGTTPQERSRLRRGHG